MDIEQQRHSAAQAHGYEQEPQGDIRTTLVGVGEMSKDAMLELQQIVVNRNGKTKYSVRAGIAYDVLQAGYIKIDPAFIPDYVHDLLIDVDRYLPSDMSSAARDELAGAMVNTLSKAMDLDHIPFRIM